MSENLRHLLNRKRSADADAEAAAASRVNCAVEEAARALRDALNATSPPGTGMRLGGANAIRAMGNALVLTADTFPAVGMGHRFQLSEAAAFCLRELADGLDFDRKPPTAKRAPRPAILDRASRPAADDDCDDL